VKSTFAYFFDPEPPIEAVMQLANDMKPKGYSLTYVDKSVFVRLEMKAILLAKGATAVLSHSSLNEDVLPDNTPKDTIADTLRYKLKWCAPTSSLTIIDPYMYPNAPDPDYETYFVKVFGDAIKECPHLTIVTLTNRNTALEAQIHSAIRLIAPQITIATKYSNVFHDRFWIGDDLRGVFVGTSLSGIGRRYAVIDYLRDEDTAQIVQRVQAMP
jgi:hypothetical protein